MLPDLLGTPGLVGKSFNPQQGNFINLTDRRAADLRSAQLDFLPGLGPDGIVGEFAAIAEGFPIQPPCLISSCRRTMMCDRAMSSHAACTGPWQPQN
jgi:hypothetical protein